MSAAAIRTGGPAAASGVRANSWLIAILVAFASFMEMLDTTTPTSCCPTSRAVWGKHGRGVLGRDDLLVATLSV